MMLGIAAPPWPRRAMAFVGGVVLLAAVLASCLAMLVLGVIL